MTAQIRNLPPSPGDVQRLGNALEEQLSSLLRLDRAELDLWRREAFWRTVRHAKQNSPFYRTHFGACDAADGGTGSDTAIAALPFTTRQDLMKAYPFGMLAVPREQVIRFGESSGTSSGQPIAAYFTAEDWVANNVTVAQALRRVLTAEDVVAVAVPYELAGVGQDLDRALERAGCLVVPVGLATPLCSPERMIGIFREIGVSALICSATRALSLAETARNMALDPRKDLKLRKLLCAGEGASAAKLDILRREWDAEIYPMLGMTETNTLGMFCPQRRMHLVESRCYFEIVDPESLRPQPDGMAGELVITSLAARAMPLVRYRTGDLCRLAAEPCGCGAPTRVLEHLGRISDRIVVGAVTLSMLEVEQAILSHLTTAPYHFGIRVASGGLRIGLTENNMTSVIQEGVTRTFQAQYGLEVEFLALDRSRVEDLVRRSVKPTIKNIYLDA